MSLNRLEQLEEFHRLDPSDPFPIYGMALEYLKIDSRKSADFFTTLLEKFPNYLPSYYQAAKLFAELGHTARAIEIYEKGIILASQQQNTNAKRELQSALEELTF